MIDLIIRGGLLMIPLGICSIIALGIIIERAFTLRHSHIFPEGFINDVQKMFFTGRVEGALALSAELRGINAIMTDFYDDADFVAELMDFCADVAIDYMRVQIDAGADSIGMSDAAASMIGPEFYEEFLWPRQMRILAAIRDTGAMTRLHMCGRTDPLLEQMEKLPVDVYELDFMTDVARAREVLGPDRVICGNVDTISTMLHGEVDDVREAAERARAICGERHVIAPGCEVAPDTPPDNVRALVGLARESQRC